MASPRALCPGLQQALSVCREHFEDLPGRGEGRRRRDCVNVGVCEAGGRALKGSRDGKELKTVQQPAERRGLQQS